MYFYLIFSSIVHLEWFTPAPYITCVFRCFSRGYSILFLKKSIVYG